MTGSTKNTVTEHNPTIIHRLRVPEALRECQGGGTIVTVFQGSTLECVHGWDVISMLSNWGYKNKLAWIQARS